jgi:surface antigen
MTTKRNRPPARIVWLAALAMLAAVGATRSAEAQYRDVFGSLRPGPGDQQIVRERVQILLDGPAGPRTLDWDNPRSGNSGAVILQQEFVRSARQCRQIEYRMIHRSQDRPEIVVLVWCKEANGRWVIVG